MIPEVLAATLGMIHIFCILLSPVQILVLFDKLDVLDIHNVLNHIAGLQNEDGSFFGDMWGEVDIQYLSSALDDCNL